MLRSGGKPRALPAFCALSFLWPFLQWVVSAVTRRVVYRSLLVQNLRELNLA